jgi:hypothetical protein
MHECTNPGHHVAVVTNGGAVELNLLALEFGI